MTSTIFALATTPGRSAVAVVRVSGPLTLRMLERIAGGAPEPRRATLRTLRDEGSQAALDRALVLWFPGPRSYTGEDQAELHLHGGPAVIASIFAALTSAGLAPAEPGEFTRRAFENGKLDLPEAEAIADLIDAETEAQRRQAVGQLSGGQSQKYEGWRATLLQASSFLEAAIDFPDEDLPGGLVDRARSGLVGLHQELAQALGDERGRRIRDGFRIALIGAPNAGKSTVLNALASRDAAMVTEIAGTTRDVIEVPLDIGGYAVLLADTAGVRASTDRLEREGIRRGTAWAEAADQRILVFDQSDEREDWRDAAALLGAGGLVLVNKTDLRPGRQAETVRAWARERKVATVECFASGGSVDGVRCWIESQLHQRLGGVDTPAITRLRHRTLLMEAIGRLESARLQQSAELMAEDVRLAARSMERLLGRIDTEAVLTEIFASFCIGK